HDLPGLLLDHHAARRLSEQEDAGQVDVDHLLPAFERVILSRRAPGGARVVDEDVDAAELFARAANDLLDVLGLANVAGHGERPPAEGADPGGRLLATLDLARAEDNVRTSLGEAGRHLAADPTAPSGDDRDLAGEVEELLRLHRSSSAIVRS